MKIIKTCNKITKNTDIDNHIDFDKDKNSNR